MKIAMFTDSYLPTIDGAVVSINITSRDLKKRGHDVVVFAPDPMMEMKTEPPDRVIWLPARRFGKYGGYRMAIYPSNIISLVRSEAPDIIHNHGISFAGIQALLASRFAGVPNILTYHTMFIDAAPYYTPIPLPMDIMAKLTWIYQRNYLKRPSVILTPTKAVQEELIRNGAVAKQWEVLPTGVDINRFDPSVSGSGLRERLSLCDEKIILSVGRIAKEKNLELLLSGFSKLRRRREDVKLVLAGSGPAVGYYKGIVNRMNLSDSVLFTGFVSDEELPSYYASCDAFAISSKFETQGIVALEAMASGKPVAGINFRAIPELIHHGENGYLFEDNAESCASILEEAIEDRKNVSRQARRTAEAFSIEICINRLVEIYSSVIEKAKS